MSWNYRIIRHVKTNDTYFGLHEVYYDDQMKVSNWNSDPDVISDEPSFEFFRKAIDEAVKKDVLNMSDLIYDPSS